MTGRRGAPPGGRATQWWHHPHAHVLEMERMATRRATSCVDAPEGHQSRAKEAECGARPRFRAGFFQNLSVAPPPLLAYVTSYVAAKCLPERARPQPRVCFSNVRCALRVETAHAAGPAPLWGGPFRFSCPRLLLCGFSTKNCLLAPARRKLRDFEVYGGGRGGARGRPQGFLAELGTRPQPQPPRQPTRSGDTEARGQDKIGKRKFIKVKTSLGFKGCHQERGKTTTEREEKTCKSGT